MTSVKTWIFATLLVLCVFRTNGVLGLCENMATSLDAWTCEPCGDIYDCTYTGAPEDSCWTSNVPDCSLPGGATQWLCCRDCTVFSTYTCDYFADGSGSWSTSGEGSQSFSYNSPQNQSLVIISSVVGVLFVIIIFSAIAAIIRRRRLAHHTTSSDYVVVYQQPQQGYQYQAAPYQPQPYQPYPPQYQQMPPQQQPVVRATGTQ
eukprot:TRINITY_DN15543_c0_g1_i1.p1 TRINITY_DN15543_c0_g1~~TRINITY_DN15543_c0_g1_i1.p1  ORF type:complete len:204 (+),score=29.84 TRINITY_DN15543_c0_g1_i1:277-888(+)